MTAPRTRTPLRIDLAELETFITVAELGSFSQAAKQLHLTQPSVTSRVQKLESALGTRLLTRTTRKVIPTPDGERLLQEGNKALDGLRALVDGFVESARLARQRVTVGATPVLAALVMPALVRDYAQRYTDVQVELLDLRYPDLVTALQEGAADFGVLAYEGGDEQFIVEPLRTEDVVVVAPANHPLAVAGRRRVALDDLHGQKLIMIDQYQPMRRQLEAAMQAQGLSLPPSPSVGNLTTLLGMMDAQMGLALLSRSIANQRRVRGDLLLEIEGVELRRRYALVHLRKAALGTAAQSFRRFVLDTMTGTGPSYWSTL